MTVEIKSPYDELLIFISEKYKGTSIEYLVEDAIIEYFAEERAEFENMRGEEQ